MLTQKRYESDRPMTTRFKDALGNQFDVMYDPATGSVIRLKFDENRGLFSTIVTKDSGANLWTANRVEKNLSPLADATQCNALVGDRTAHTSSTRKTRTLELVRPTEPIPVFTRVLADARFDAHTGELTLASCRLSKRWVFRANGKAEFFSAEGHRSFA